MTRRGAGVWYSYMRVTYSKRLLDGLAAYGFDDKESRIYLAGLEIGAASVLDLSRRTALPRTTLYPILENFCRRGFFQLRKIKGRTAYAAEPPATFLKRLEDREKTFRDILPDLEGLRGAAGDAVGVTMYEGSEGFRQFWQKLFRSGVKEYRLLTSVTGLREYAHEEYLVKHVITERMRLGIKSLQLIPENALTKKVVATDARQLRESRYLPPDVTLPATTLIFGNEVAFITTRKENSVILVASGDIAVTLKTAFDLMWAGAKSSK